MRVGPKIVAGVVSLIISTLGSTAAWACDDCGKSATGTRLGNGGGTNAGERTERAGGGAPGSPAVGGGDTSVACDVFLPLEDGRGEGTIAEPADPGTIEVGTVVWLACYDAVTRDFLYSAEIVWTGGAPAAYVPPEILAQRARADLYLPLPAIRTWPEPANQVVHLPTWLHVDNFEAGSRSATAGSVTATVTARPISVVWSMGDGRSVSCSTAGETFEPSTENSRAGDSSDCSHTFTTTSGRQPGQVFRGSVTITWHLDWTSNIGVSGDLGDVSMTAGVSWRVEQIQSLITKRATP